MRGLLCIIALGLALPACVPAPDSKRGSGSNSANSANSVNNVNSANSANSTNSVNAANNTNSSNNLNSCPVFDQQPPIGFAAFQEPGEAFVVDVADDWIELDINGEVITFRWAGASLTDYFQVEDAVLIRRQSTGDTTLDIVEGETANLYVVNANTFEFGGLVLPTASAGDNISLSLTGPDGFSCLASTECGEQRQTYTSYRLAARWEFDGDTESTEIELGTSEALRNYEIFAYAGTSFETEELDVDGCVVEGGASALLSASVLQGF